MCIRDRPGREMPVEMGSKFIRSMTLPVDGSIWERLRPWKTHLILHLTKKGSICTPVSYTHLTGVIVRKVIDAFETGGGSTIIGSGKKTLPHYAALANGVMLRYWDFNDSYHFPMGKMLSGSHPSEIIPTCLAVGEGEQIDGKELLTSIVLGYELSGRFIRAIRRLPLENRGWNFDSRGAFITPLVAGRLMKLSREQMENAFGTVSYTHLDVYKRQVWRWWLQKPWRPLTRHASS